MKLLKLSKTRKALKTTAKVVSYPFKKIATDEDLQKKLLEAALNVAIAYAEAKAKGNGDEFMMEFKKHF